MAKQTVQFEININSKKGETTLKSLSKGFDDITIKSKQAGQAAQQLGIKLKDLQTQGATLSTSSKAFQGLGTSISGVSAASGGATASVLELGRAISDAPYGIRGVANNLSQLASNLVFTTKAAGGFGNAIKALGKELMGPLGLLLAIQAIIAAIEYFSMNMKKANETMAELSAQGITTNVAKLHLLREALNDSAVATEDQILALNKAGTEFKELNGFIEDGAINLDKFNTQITNMIDKMKEVAFAKAVLKETEEVMQDFVKTVVKGAGPTFGEKVAGLLNPFASGEMIGAARFADDVKLAGEQYDKLYNMLLSKQKDGDGILLEHLFGRENKSGSGGRTGILKQQLLDLSKLILDNYKKAASMSEKSEVELLEIRQGYERDDLKRRRDNFIEKQRQRHKDFLSKKRTDEEIAQADATLKASLIQAEKEYQEALTSLSYLQATQRFNQQLELIRKFNQDMLKLRGVSARARAASVGTDTSTGRLNRPQSDVGAENIDNIVSAQEAVGVIRQEEFQEALAAKEQQLKLAHLSDIQIKSELRQMQHAFDIETMDQEIELERMKIEAKKQINLEYVSWAGGLGQIFKNIAGDNEALAKTALILEKGSKIASIIIETTAANQMILAASAVRASYGDPKAVALAKIRVAKNKIGAGISIATILSTGLNSKGLKGGGPSVGGSGSGAPSREFDFNLVGSTRENQLAEGVAGQFGQPIQAYVVSSQITSQQQLDNTIQTQASLGD